MRTDKGRITSWKTECLTRQMLKKFGGSYILRREMTIIATDVSCVKDIFAVNLFNGDTFGIEVKTHISDITSSPYGKECCSCNYNYFLVWTDCYYYIERYLKEKQFSHVGIIVGCQNWLDVVREPARITDCWGHK